MVTAALIMDSKVAGLFCFVLFFQGQYLPSLKTNCLTINKDMEKQLPQVHNCITQRWKIVVSNVVSWRRLQCTIVEKTVDAEKYRCKENR